MKQVLSHQKRTVLRRDRTYLLAIPHTKVLIKGLQRHSNGSCDTVAHYEPLHRRATAAAGRQYRDCYSVGDTKHDQAYTLAHDSYSKVAPFASSVGIMSNFSEREAKLMLLSKFALKASDLLFEPWTPFGS